MLIDWFTVAAQTLNFLVLVWLLKRFLYQPILDAIDAREKDVGARLADANAKQASAQKEHALFVQSNADLALQSAELRRQAVAQAQAERERLLGQARAEADALRVKRRDALDAEWRSLGEDIARRARLEVFALARKTLGELADSTLEQQMCAVFLSRLHALDGDAKAALLSALARGSGPVLVRSTYELAAAQREALQRAVDDCGAGHVAVRFETAPRLISGIELSANGYQLSWSIADYLAAMEQRVADELHAAGNAPAPGPGAPPASSGPGAQP